MHIAGQGLVPQKRLVQDEDDKGGKLKAKIATRVTPA